MTREECLDWLYRLRGEIYVYIQPKEWLIPMNNALDMAIKALEHPKQNVIAVVPCGDAISRQAVLNILDDMVREYIKENDFDKAHGVAWVKVQKLPSVSTEKTGRWEWNQYDYNPNLGNWHCSECRSVVIECVDKNKKGGIPLYKYCPQCGAKMEVEDG